MEMANAAYNHNDTADLQPQEEMATIHANPSTSEDLVKVQLCSYFCNKRTPYLYYELLPILSYDDVQCKFHCTLPFKEL